MHYVCVHVYICLMVVMNLVFEQLMLCVHNYV